MMKHNHAQHSKVAMSKQSNFSRPQEDKNDTKKFQIFGKLANLKNKQKIFDF